MAPNKATVNIMSNNIATEMSDLPFIDTDNRTTYLLDEIYGSILWPVKEGYNLAAQYYDSWYWQKFWIDNELPLIRSEIDSFENDSSPAVDVGTGSGKYLNMLIELGFNAIGIDISIAMIKQAELNSIDKSILACADVRKVPLETGSVSLITACRVTSHIDDLESMFNELARITKSNGKLIISDVSAFHDYDVTRIPSNNGYIHIETYKHDLEKIVRTANLSDYWKVDRIRTVKYNQLLIKPDPSIFMAIDILSKCPIFYYGVLSRTDKKY